ncbi:MAG: FxsA family protein [Methylophilus sp.]|nr:FxsA family protein [Methylophilus sp.]
MRLVIALILLAFPIAEIVLLIQLADQYGWWLLLYLVVIGFLGLQLIRGEKVLMAPRMMQSMMGGNPVKALLGTARNMVAGVLLLIPGVISDVIAVVLLLIPIEQTKPNPQGDVSGKGFGKTKYQQSANDDVIEGEFTHIKEDLEKK